MQSNPVLKKLGFADDDRLVIIHTDDIGMCQASVAAYADLVDFGLISSAAVMVPCPWFPAAAAFCREHPQVDMGVHLTLTSEWEKYRWRPLSTVDPASGLLDEAGFFHRRAQPVFEHGDPDAAQRETSAQLARALAAGIDVTHVDTHMGAVGNPKFMPAYIQVALQNKIPCMVPRQDEAGFRAMGVDAETAAFAAQFTLTLEEMGLPLLDYMIGMPLDQPEGQLDLAKKMLSELPPGITHFILHPSIDTPELRAITHDWPGRVANYRTFLSEDLRKFIRDIGLHVIGYRALRDLMRPS